MNETVPDSSEEISSSIGEEKREHKPNVRNENNKCEERFSTFFLASRSLPPKDVCRINCWRVFKGIANVFITKFKVGRQAVLATTANTQIAASK